ncbi:MAG: energy transducer TonB [Bacteroidetes bacterium]|nr:energy transducer TonB [Bacteroidota bacterium]
MLTSKLDLYKGEWLELVFDDRNKAYGAYDLRKHYNRALLKAMAVTFSAVICLLLGYNTFHKNGPTETVYTIPYIKPMVEPEAKKPVIPAKPRTVEPPKSVATVKYPIFKVTVDKEAQNPPKITDLKGAVISTETKKGDETDANIEIPNTTGTTGSDITEDKTIHTIASVEVMPQFPGGEAAWIKYLQKNLHYPSQAAEAGISGRVYVSFVVEKDGHLTDIKVERGSGYGLDEEAVRVLKMAPPWTPGIQNGQKVRVSYVMPITFQIAAQD